MELELKNGDYVPDGIGGVHRVSGREALAQRVLFRLTARRGSFPFWPELGSRLYQLAVSHLPAICRCGAVCYRGPGPGACRCGGGYSDTAARRHRGAAGTAFLPGHRAGCNAGGAGVREDKNHEDCGRNL